MIRTALAALGLLALTSGASLAAGDPSAGKAKAAICASCHGVDGNGSPANGEWPALAGQHAGYTVDQIKAFQKGEERSNLIMAPMIAEMNDQDIVDVAAYYETLPRRSRFADEDQKASIVRGQKLYRGGNKERGIAACTGCHLPDGSGNGSAGFPALAGQTADYTAIQLRQFRSGERSNDHNSMMRDIAGRLSEQDIEDLSRYLTGLR